MQRNVSDWWLNLAFNFGGQGPDADPLPALQDKNVRMAIAMAIDKEGIVEKAFDGAAVPGTSLIRQVPEQWHYDVPDDELIPFDPDAANAAARRERLRAPAPTASASTRTPATGSPSGCRSRRRRPAHWPPGS